MTVPRLEPFRRTPPDRGLPHALRDPFRIALLVGGGLLFFGSLLSWINVWLPGHGWIEVSSFERFGDGAITLEIGLLVAAFAWADRTATSRLPIALVVPVVLGAAALLLMKVSWDQAEQYLDGLKNGGGHGYLLPGFWLTLVGAALTTAIGAVIVARARRDVRFAVRVSRATAMGTAGGAIGAVAGIGAAVLLGEDVATNPTVAGSAVTFLSIVLGIVGAWLGSRIGRSFAGDGDAGDAGDARA